MNQLKTIFLAAIVALLVGCRSTPRLIADDPWVGTIQVGGKNWNIETIGPGAKILKWSRWQPDFPELYVIELHDGEATGVHHTFTHSLVVLDTTSPENGALLHEQIFSSITRLDESSGKAETQTHTTPYKLSKNSEGKPCVLLGDSPKPLGLKHTLR